MKRALLISSLVVSILAVGVYLARVPLVMALAGKVAQQRLSVDKVNELEDGLHVGLCGAGSPFVDDKHSGPCTVVVAGKHVLIFDAGSGSARTLAKMGINAGNIEAIFLTHFHSDHIDGLGELLLQRWVLNSNRVPVALYAPPGGNDVLNGIMQAYQHDQHYRVSHHGDLTVPASGFGAQLHQFDTSETGRRVILKDAELEVVAFDVDHGPVHPAVGYRITYKGRKLVLSGDTKKSVEVQREAEGADVLVHEALSLPLTNMLAQAAGKAGRANLQKIFTDITNYHTTPQQAAEVARDAHVGYLLLNHLVPALPMPGLETAFLGNAGSIYGGPLTLGRDGDWISLPSGSKEIHFQRLF